MRLVATVLLLATVSAANRWGGYDILGAHGGVFRALPWTTQEIAMISHLHARGDYHVLMAVIKDKLIESGDELTSIERKEIERFLVVKRPPPAVVELLDQAEKAQIDALHSEGGVFEVLDVWKQAIARVPDGLKETVYNYISPPTTPDPSAL